MMIEIEENELEEVDIPQDEVNAVDEEIEAEEYVEEEESIEDSDNKFFLVKEGIDAEFSQPSPVPVYKHDGLQSYMDVLVLLKNINPNDARLTRVAPQRPVVAGQVYVYALVPGQSAYDWRFDGFQWANLRANSFPKKNANPILTRHEFRLLDNGTKVDFFRHEYHEPGHNFKTPINISNWKNPYIIIHYFGNYPVNEAQLAPHAGRRTGGGPVMRTPKRPKSKDLLISLNTGAIHSESGRSVLGGYDDEGGDESRKCTGADAEDETCIKRRRTEMIQIYGGDAAGGSCGTSIDLGQLALLTANGIEVTGPNLKHRNSSTKTKTKPSLYVPNCIMTKEDIYGCYVFHEAFSGAHRVIRKLDFTSGSNIVIAEDHLLNHINTLATMDFLGGKLTFTYQATAKLYHFLVSTLFVRHPVFDTQPYIPVAVLLHRRHNAETHESFFRTMKGLITVLNSAEIDLIICDENGVTKAVENELPEIPTVHVSDASGPRISSSKLDYLLVSVAKSLTFDHTKMIHLVYFLQCHFFNEISRSLAGTYNCEWSIHSKYEGINRSTLIEKLLPDEEIEILEDALSPSELISMLSRNPPQVVGSGSDYEGCSQNELQLFEGLAHFFIAKDRIEWLKSKGVFSVKGLGGNEYHVKLSGRSCTCPRGKACEHVLAVLIATGLLTRQQ